MVPLVCRLHRDSLFVKAPLAGGAYERAEARGARLGGEGGAERRQEGFRGAIEADEGARHQRGRGRRHHDAPSPLACDEPVQGAQSRGGMNELAATTAQHERYHGNDHGAKCGRACL